jgi:hypothetical protein
MHEGVVDRVAMRGEGGHAGGQRDAFGVDQGAVEIEEDGVIGHGHKIGPWKRMALPIPDQRCSR